jgi:phosphoglycolate phosphatase-like HAD superfamily hydrolase
VGDTVADIDCARSFGARAVVVATGFQSRDDLERSSPDVLLSDFENTDKALEAILMSAS